jgi:hypothetical protein
MAREFLIPLLSRCLSAESQSNNFPTRWNSYYGDDLATLRPNGTAQARSRFRRSFLPEA